MVFPLFPSSFTSLSAFESSLCFSLKSIQNLEPTIKPSHPSGLYLLSIISGIMSLCSWNVYSASTLVKNTKEISLNWLTAREFTLSLFLEEMVNCDCLVLTDAEC